MTRIIPVEDSSRREFPISMEGPWTTEPEAAKVICGDYPCVARRGLMGHWCAYVGLPSTHKHYGEEDEFKVDLEVHGGVTYSQHSTSLNEMAGFPSDAEMWWIGWDYNHAGDSSPWDIQEYGHGSGNYTPLEIVVEDIEEAMRQL